MHPALAASELFRTTAYLPAPATVLAASKLPGGAAFYALRVRENTTLPLDPQAIHHTGKREVARTQAALDELLPPHQADIEGILDAMQGLPVKIRLLATPLHEFVPDVAELHEVTPILGPRGCRLELMHTETD